MSLAFVLVTPASTRYLAFNRLNLAQQMTLDVNNAWGVLHAIIGKCLDLSIGKYVLLKDPNKVNEEQLSAIVE